MALCFTLQGALSTLIDEVRRIRSANQVFSRIFVYLLRFAY
jgi:hypothetical protein